MLIIVSNVAVDLWVDVLTGIDVDVLMEGNVNVFAGVMTTLEFAIPGPLEKGRC